ncbi:MAG: hypothetical protein V3T84_07320 [Phycisphaerales bacterium]
MTRTVAPVNVIKLASIIAASSAVAFMASLGLESQDQTAEPASSRDVPADQSGTKAPDKARANDDSPSLGEVPSALPTAGGTEGHFVRDADLGRDILRDPLGRRHRRVARELTPEMIEECLEVAHEVKPQLASRLERLRRDSTEAQFEQAMRRNARHLLNLVRLRERNPGLYDLKMRELQTGEQIQRVTAQLREALDTGSTAHAQILETELHALVQLQASQSIEARGRYLLRIQEHMEALKQQIEDEASNFEQTVERRFQEILDQIKSSSTTSTEPTTG